YGDERDRERGAFVRLEATSGEERGRPDFLRWRERLWKANARRWTPARAVLRDSSSWGGLVWAEADCAGLIRHRPRESWAWVASLKTGPEPGQTPALLAAPALGGVASLCLPGLPHVLAALTASSCPEALRDLRLAGLAKREASAFLRSGIAFRLRSLFVEGPVPAAAWEALARLPGLQNLGVPSPDPTFFRSAACRLKSLSADASWPGRPFAAMTRSDCAAGLRQLFLHGKGACPSLPSARFWPTLEHLSFRDRRCDPVALATVPAAPRLRVLDLYWTGLDAAGLRLLASSPLCAALDCLRLGGSVLGPDGARALAAMPAAPLALDLAGAHLGDDGVSILAAWPGLARCRVLTLSYNKITAAGVAALAKSPHAAGLVGLSLFANPIRDEGLRRLLRAPFLPRLESLDINSCHLHSSATKMIQAADLPAMRQLSADHEQPHRLRAALPHIPCVA
ncbi:MAG: hypothetical protein K2W96_19515, partial [Gemmataceae bacterium]|nr:hypothetical protein [Gemmataceae bacterium]